MRYINLFENKKTIEKIVKGYFGITGKYSINDDDSIDIFGRCELIRRCRVLSIRINKLKGGFIAFQKRLETLSGFPEHIDGGFSVHYNLLTSLTLGPNYVNGNYDCANNMLISLEGAPTRTKFFNCDRNNLTSLVGAPTHVNGDFYCRGNKLVSLDGFPKILKGLFACTWNKDLPLLRTLTAERGVAIYRDSQVNNLHDRITAILSNARNNNPNNLRHAILDAQRTLIEAGYAGNARW
jgi:hypothetical protein